MPLASTATAQEQVDSGPAKMGQEKYWIDYLHSFLSHADLNVQKRNPAFATKYQALLSQFHKCYIACHCIHDMVIVYNLKGEVRLNQSCPIFEHYLKVGCKAVMSSSQAKQWVDTKVITKSERDVVERRRQYYDMILRVKELRAAFRTLVEFCLPLMESNNDALQVYNDFKNFAAYEIVFLTKL